MLFQKPKDLKYTDMCIYIDSIIERGNPSDKELELIFQYLYHIAFMLSHKKKYFNKSYYYEQFAVYFATTTLHRLFLNPRLNKVDENGEPELSQIKSVLNYMKGVIYPRKVEFEQENYSQKYQEMIDCEYLESFNSDPYNAMREIDVSLYIKELPKTIRHIVKENNFYKSDKLLMKNIYLSCLLTVINGISLSNSDIDEIETKYSSIEAKYRLLAKIFYKNKRKIILYHLDNKFYPYIKVLVNKIYAQLEKDIRELSNSSYNLSNEALTTMLFLDVNGEINE